jgi:hypothetical protein
MVFLDLNVYTALKVALVWQDHNKKFDFYEYLAFSCKHALAVEIFFSKKKEEELARYRCCHTKINAWIFFSFLSTDLGKKERDNAS